MFPQGNKHFALIFLIPVFLTACLGKGELTDRVLQEAHAMGDALVKKDYKKYASYSIDWAYQYAGGMQVYMAGIKRVVEQYESRGRRFSKVHFELISDVKEKDGVYQCMLSQTTTISGQYADQIDEAIIYGISEDAENWKFAAITYMPKEQLKKLSPYLHPDLKNPNWKK